MSLEFIDEFFNTGFEEEAELKIDSASEAVNIIIVFDNEFEAAQLTNIQFEGNNPVAMCRTKDLAGIKNKISTLKIQGITYTILEKHPDGRGITFVELITD